MLGFSVGQSKFNIVIYKEHWSTVAGYLRVCVIGCGTHWKGGQTLEKSLDGSHEHNYSPAASGLDDTCDRNTSQPRRSPEPCADLLSGSTTSERSSIAPDAPSGANWPNPRTFPATVESSTTRNRCGFIPNGFILSDDNYLSRITACRV